MSEQTKKIIIGLLVAAVFIVCMTLVIIGQKNAGPQGLAMMLAGLAGLLVLLWLYNRKYR